MIININPHSHLHRREHCRMGWEARRKGLGEQEESRKESRVGLRRPLRAPLTQIPEKKCFRTRSTDHIVKDSHFVHYVDDHLKEHVCYGIATETKAMRMVRVFYSGLCASGLWRHGLLYLLKIASCIMKVPKAYFRVTFRLDMWM